MSKLKKLFTLALVALGITALAAEKCTDCITFSADAPFGIKMWKKGTPAEPNLEWSTDQINWSKFDLENGAAAGEDHTLYLRGTNNTAFAKGNTKYHAFTNTTDSAATAIACSGNIMTLLDYEKVAKGEEPTVNDSAFSCLFNGFAVLTAAPALPAKDLATMCYLLMFNGCTSLTAAPELPATNLAINCYSQMFKGCTALTNAPALSATNLANGCYSQMFRGCTALVVNTNAPGKAWSIPSDAATSATKATDWNLYMFKDTFGNIADAAVTPGVTYYIVEPVKIPYTAPEAVENATFKVCMGGEEVTDGMVWSNRTDNVASPADPIATVVYTANEGYAFEDGTTEMTVALDTRVSPAKAGAAPEAPRKSELVLGVVAQRYPWNGIVDVNYKTAYWPKKDGLGAVEITCGDQVCTATLDIYATGKGKTGVASHAVDLKWLFGEVQGNAQFKALVSDKPIGFADVKPLAAGDFPAELADKACTFRSMDIVTSADESQVSPFAEWKVDFVLTAEEDIDKGSIALVGLIGGEWITIPTPAKLEAGKEVAVVVDWLKQIEPYKYIPGLPQSWHYSSKTVKEFTCGVKNNAAANTGKKLKVVLRLTSHLDPKDTLDIATIETTLAAPASEE